MSKSESLREILADEIKGLWRADDQTLRILGKLNDGIRDQKLKQNSDTLLNGIKQQGGAEDGGLARPAFGRFDHCPPAFTMADPELRQYQAFPRGA